MILYAFKVQEYFKLLNETSFEKRETTSMKSDNWTIKRKKQQVEE